MNKKDEVLVDYVAWNIANKIEIAQKYYDYLERVGLLSEAVKRSKEVKNASV